MVYRPVPSLNTRFPPWRKPPIPVLLLYRAHYPINRLLCSYSHLPTFRRYNERKILKVAMKMSQMFVDPKPHNAFKHKTRFNQVSPTLYHVSPPRQAFSHTFRNLFLLTTFLRPFRTVFFLLKNIFPNVKLSDCDRGEKI